MTLSAREFHDLTAHTADRHPLVPVPDARVRQDFLPMTRPVPEAVKHYPEGTRRVVLPVGDVGGDTWSLDALARTLRRSIGYVAPLGMPRRTRAASSAGGRYPIDAYVRAVGLAGLPDGVWYVDPVDDRLLQVASDPGSGPAAVILTAVPWRSCWKYAERGYRMLWWDAGTVVASWQVASAARGLPTGLLVGLSDHDLSSTVGCLLPDELPVAALSLGAPASWAPLPGPVEAGSTGPVETFCLVTDAHVAGASPEPTDGIRAGPRTELPDDQHLAERLDDAIGRRRSSRRFDRSARPSLDDVVALLGDTAVLPGPDDGPTLRLVVHDVRGLAPGSYVWRDGALLCDGPALSRDDARQLCLDQEPAAQCAFLVIWTTDLDDGVSMRAYRCRQLAAGRALGRTYLAAVDHGLGCTGLTFVDDLVRNAFGADGLVAAAVGVPDSATQPTGRV